MQKMTRLMLALLLLGLIFVSVARADDDDDSADEAAGHSAPEEEEEVKEKGTDAAGVSVRAFFPKNRNHKFPAGEWAETLVAIDNNADNQNFRVEYVLAYLRGAHDSTYYIQNFTGAAYNRTVASGGVTSVKYRFKPDAAIDPRDYGLVVQAFYQNDDNETFLSVAFNETVTITDAVSSFDAASFFTYAIVIAGLGAAAYVAKGKFFVPVKAAKKKVQQQTELGTSVDGVNLEFVPKSHLTYISKTTPKSPPSNTPKTKKQ